MGSGPSTHLLSPLGLLFTPNIFPIDSPGKIFWQAGEGMPLGPLAARPSRYPTIPIRHRTDTSRYRTDTEPPPPPIPLGRALPQFKKLHFVNDVYATNFLNSLPKLGRYNTPLVILDEAQRGSFRIPSETRQHMHQTQARSTNSRTSHCGPRWVLSRPRGINSTRAQQGAHFLAWLDADPIGSRQDPVNKCAKHKQEAQFHARLIADPVGSRQDPVA